MNPEVKERWIAALRSGEYDQGKNLLRFEEKFCCLGVLCDLHSKETGNEWDIVEGIRETYLGMNGYLPAEVVEWAGLDTNNPRVKTVQEKLVEKDLAFLNDVGYSFYQISDLIEVQL
jgi:hypothetical protein